MAFYSNVAVRLVAATARLQEIRVVAATARLKEMLKGLMNIPILRMQWYYLNRNLGSLWISGYAYRVLALIHTSTWKHI